MGAYFRTWTGNRHHWTIADWAIDQPANTSGVVEHDGKLYVVLLHNVNGVLAVYRVTNRAILKRLRRWPSAIDGEW